MANQPTTMANQSTSITEQSEDSRSAQQMNLCLNYRTRNGLINCLVELSTILESNRPIPEDAKDRTCKKIKESIGLLAELLPFESTPSVDDSATFEEQIAVQLTLELPSEEQVGLIKHLLENRNAVLFYDKTTNQTRSSLIAENKRMIVQLMRVPSEEPSERIDGVGSAEGANGDENTGEPISKRQRGI